MTLCDHCNQPLDLHLGFNHGAGKCIIARGALDLTLKFGWERAKAVIEQASAWYAARQEAQQVANSVGEGI